MEIRVSDRLLTRFKNRANIVESVAAVMLVRMSEAVAISRIIVSVRTGNLQSKIGIIDWDPSIPEISGGVIGVPYAVFVEFGTRFMHERPFWRPPVWEAFFRMLDDFGKINRGEISYA